MSRLTPELRELIRARRREGRTLQEIATELGLTKAAIGVVAQAADESRDWTRADAILRERFSSGSTLREIATEVGVPYAVLRERVHLLCLERVDVRDKGAEHRRERDRRNTAESRARGVVSHGQSGFARGCDCPSCSAAHLGYTAPRDTRTRAAAHHHAQPWSEAEDTAVLDDSRRIEDIALDLGRTYHAVATRRHNLHRSRTHQKGQ